MQKYLLYAYITIAPVTAWSAALSQNDVSILIPLPQSLASAPLFQPTSMGAFGELLPKIVYDKMPALEFQTPDETFKKLRVVGVRIDPCFPLTPPATGCQPQIRMIWQPIVGDANEQARSIDAAVHTFYNLSSDDFSILIAELEKLKTTKGSGILDEVLSVNPLLKKFGLDSAYAKELFSILLSHVGSKRLSQATFMQLSGLGNVWIFGGFLISGSQIADLPIPRITGFTQTFQSASSTYFLSSGASPAPKGADTFNLLIRESRDITRADEPEVIESTMSTFRIENPNNHNPHTVDCVSCHIAQAARTFATRQYPWLFLEGRGQQFKFQSKFNLINLSPNQNNTMLLRSFGYSGVDPAISQRTINETAAVLEKLYSAP